MFVCQVITECENLFSVKSFSQVLFQETFVFPNAYGVVSVPCQKLDDTEMESAPMKVCDLCLQLSDIQLALAFMVKNLAYFE